MFSATFVLSFAMDFVSGFLAYNQQQAMQHLARASLGRFALPAQFWSSTLETWQAEYLIAICIVLSIVLRQQDPAESKPLESSDQDTGTSNH